MSFACRGKLAECPRFWDAQKHPPRVSGSGGRCWGSAWLGCTELSLGLLAFPICKAHNFIFPLKVSLLIPLTHSIEKIHFGGVKACVSLDPLRELALGSMLQGGEEMRIQRPSPVLYLCLSPASKICPCTKSQKTVYCWGFKPLTQ